MTQSFSTFIRISGPIPEVEKSALINDYEIILAYCEEFKQSKVQATGLAWSKYIFGGRGLRVGATRGNGCFFYCNLSLKHYFQHDHFLNKYEQYFQHEYEHFFFFKTGNLFNLNWIQDHCLVSFYILEKNKLHRIKQSITYL